MSVYNRIYADAADADGLGSHSVYATARSSTAATTASNTTGTVGQGLFGGPTYAVYQVFEVFNTSALPTGIPTATLSISQFNSLLASEDTVEVRAVSAVTNLIAGNSLAAQTPLFGSLAFPTTSGRKTISFADISALPRTSSCKLLLHSQNQRTSTAPTASTEQITFYCADQTGTTNDPYLETVGGWSIVGVGTVVEAATTAITLTEPAGVANGDLLVACFASRSTATTAVTNTGWTAVNSQNNNNVSATAGSAIGSGTMLYQVRAGTPDLSFVVPAGISVIRGQIVAYRGNATTTPLDVSTAGTTGAVTAVSVTGLTTTQDDDLIVAMAAGGQEATWSAFSNVTTPLTASGATDTTTAPSTTAWIERAESITTTGADTSLGIFDALKTAAGATGNLTVTASIASGHVVVAGAFKIAPPPSTADAWNLNDKSANITLSNSDKTATCTSVSSGGIRSTTPHMNISAGKYYAEIRLDTKVGNPLIGITPNSQSLTGSSQAIYVSSLDGQITLYTGTGPSLGRAMVSGDVVCIAWDAGAQKIWFRFNGSDWNNNASADPGTSANGTTTTGSIAENHSLWFVASSVSEIFTVRTELAEFTQAVPSGFSSWMGETPLVNRTIAADAGSYALSGADATLTKAGGAVSTYTLVGDAGSYALSGATAGLYRGREVLAVAGSYALTGATASLERGREVDAVAGSYALSGTAASLELGKEVPALAGTYAATGTAATLRHGWKIAADGSSYALTGAAATLTKGAAIVHRTLPAVAGSHALTGIPASLEYGREVAAIVGSYALTGTAVSLERGREVPAIAGSYALSGTAATFRRSWKTVAVSGSYTISGLPANLLRLGAYAIIGLPGSYALTGTDTTLIKAGGAPSIWVGLTAGATLGILGSGGSLPTGWEILSSNCTVEVVGVGVNDDDVECFDIQVTMPGGEGSGYIDIYFPAGVNGVSGAAPGETWRSAAYLKFLSYTGSTPTYNSIDIGGVGDDEHWIDTSSDLTAIADSGAFQLSYREEQLTFSAADVTHAAGEIYLEADDTSGPISYTLRLAAKLEKTAHGIIGLPGAYALAGTAASLEKESALAVASLAFDATAIKGLGGFGTETYTVTVAAAAEQERLVFLAAVSNNSTADFIDCTIDGQTATRVGTLSVGAGSNPCVITAYRAPGTANTSIDIVVTIENSAYASYCACYKLSNAGALLATTNVSGGDPTLDVGTAAGGTTAAALLGYSDVAGPTVSWTGLSEDFDGVSMFGDEVFSGASADNATAATPLAIVADSTVVASVASLVVSFRLAAAAAAFDANSIGSAPDRTFSLAVAEAEGQERLIVLAAVTNGATADFSAVTVDGEAATRIGSLSQGALDGGGNRAIITAWRAPGTASTAIDVVVTIDGDVYSSYCACFRLADAGVAVSINVAGNDPNLSIDTTADGTVVAATLGYVGGGLTPNTAWSGLTERFDGVTVFGDEVFSGASSDLGIGTAETPRPIAADFDETLLGATSSVASIVLAFPYAVAAEAATYTLAAAAGSYALSGTAATLSKAIASTYTLAAAAGSYGLAGSAAVIGHGLIVEAGSYALTGGSATLTKLGVGDRLLPAGAGSYQLTGSPVSLIWSGEVPIVTSGQADGDIVRRRTQKRRARIFYIVSETAKKIVERPGPLRKKRKKLAKAIAEEVLEAAGGLLAPDRLALEQAIRRRLEALPLTELHTEGWSELQDRLMQVIADAEEIAQRLRAEQEEEDDLLLLLAS